MNHHAMTTRRCEGVKDDTGLEIMTSGMHPGTNRNSLGLPGLPRAMNT